MSSSLQHGLDALEAAASQETERDRVLLATLRGLLQGYDHWWGGHEWEEVEVERTVVLPLINPATGRSSRTWNHGGKRDGIVVGYGKRLLMEHKTTGSNIQDPDDPYWRQLAVDAQLSHYALGAWQDGEKVDGTLYDVVRKPSIRPKKLTKATIDEIVRRRTYLGAPITEDEQMGVIDGSITGETPALYEIRLLQDITERPEFYFQRRSIPRSDSDLVEWAEELWEVGEDIRRARVRQRRGENPWYRNSGACMAYNRPCTYLGICSGYDTEDSENWTRKGFVHPELEVDDVGGDGRDLLTHSRIQCWQRCRRLHYFRYELGLERIDEDEGEALYLGSLWHEAQEAWWSAASQTTGDQDVQHPEGALTESAPAVDVARP